MWVRDAWYFHFGNLGHLKECSVNVGAQHLKASEIEFSVFTLSSTQTLLESEKLPNRITNRVEKQVKHTVGLA